MVRGQERPWAKGAWRAGRADLSFLTRSPDSGTGGCRCVSVRAGEWMRRVCACAAGVPAFTRVRVSRSHAWCLCVGVDGVCVCVCVGGGWRWHLCSTHVCTRGGGWLYAQLCGGVGRVHAHTCGGMGGGRGAPRAMVPLLWLILLLLSTHQLPISP